MEIKRLCLDTIEYELNEKDSWTNEEGQMFEFISLKKIATYKGKKKYQNLTIKHEHFEKFKEWMREIVEIPF